MKNSVSINIEIEKESLYQLGKEESSGENAVEHWNRAYNLEKKTEVAGISCLGYSWRETTYILLGKANR